MDSDQKTALHCSSISNNKTPTLYTIFTRISSAEFMSCSNVETHKLFVYVPILEASCGFSHGDNDVTDVSNCVRSALNVVDMIGEIGNFHCNKRTYKVSRRAVFQIIVCDMSHLEIQSVTNMVAGVPDMVCRRHVCCGVIRLMNFSHYECHAIC